MAQKANLKGAKSARDSFGPLYNKILAGKFGGVDDTSSTSLAASMLAKGSPLKRKGIVESGGDDDDEDEVASSPLKKVKGKKGTATPRKGKAKGKGKDEVKADVNDDVKEADEDGDNIVVKAEVFGGAGEEA